MKYFSVLFAALLIVAFATFASAQSDPFGQVDRVYADSVVAAAGQDVAVHFFLRNDELLSAVSVPLVYDTSKLTLKSISFAGSRAEYLQTKIVNPAAPAETKGRYVVAFLKILESAIPTGDGLLFTCIFTVRPSVSTGTTMVIDSLFYPPGNELLLSENTTSTSIHPAFQAGKIVVRQANRAPQFTPIATQYAFEGDTLRLDIQGTDPDNDSLRFALTTKPANAQLAITSRTSARVTWVPSFVGPYSADGSPFAIGVWMSDGVLSVGQEVAVQVVNRNRPPQITAPTAIETQAGENLSFVVSASDPDFEAVSWRLTGAPYGSNFDGNNPGRFSWQVPVTDSGSSAMTFVATDPQGFSDTARVPVHIAAATLYSLTIDTTSAFSGETATCYLRLDNRLAVGGFNLLARYDASALSLGTISKLGTRAESFTNYTITTNVDGQAGLMRIIGQAPAGSPLSIGDGPIVKMTFRTTGDLSFAGQSIPVKFEFLDVITKDDNTLTTPGGQKVPQTDIYYSSGYVKINEIGQIRVGDINLNGVAYEISDIIYFTNFFIYPSQHPFNALQYANSDVNQDGMLATVADLVRLVNIVINGGLGSGRTATYEAKDASLTSEAVPDAVEFRYDTESDIGGLLLTIETADQINLDELQCPNSDMTVMSNRDGNRVRVLVYGAAGQSMPSGSQCFLRVSGLKDYRVVALELATADGTYIPVKLPASESLPQGYDLAQNYPNPFNPETRIAFSLPSSGEIRLAIYNVLGREVRTLVSSHLEAGQHTAVWDGRDNAGATAASGVYFYRLEASGYSMTRKMMLLK